MPGGKIILDNAKVEAGWYELSVKKYGPDATMPSGISYVVTCRSQSEAERKSIFCEVLDAFEATLRDAGVAAMAQNKARVRSEFAKLRRDFSKYVKGRNPISIVMDLSVADTDDDAAHQVKGNISVKIDDKEKINIPLKVLQVSSTPGERPNTFVPLSVLRLVDAAKNFEQLVKRNNDFV